MKIVYFKTGGSGEPIATNKEELLTSIKNLAASAKESARPFVITVQRYDSLPSWPKNAKNIAYSLQTMGSQYERFKTLYDQAEFIKTNPTLFILNRGITPEQIEATQDLLKARLNSINSQIGRCVETNTAKDCTLSAADAVSDYSFRILFPVRPDSFVEDVNLSAYRSQLVRQNAALQQVQQTSIADQVAAAVSDVHSIKAAKIAGINQEIAASNRQISAAENAYPEALRNAIQQQWISFASSTRCRISVEDSGCLSNAEISAWGAKITVK